jgi:hypothetical protein
VRLVKRARVVAPLPHMPAGMIHRVPVRSESTVCLLQAARQSILVLRHSNEMNVIGHQAITDQLDRDGL